MKNVIITGADGFVGSYTVAKFLAEGCHVLAIDITDVPHRLKPSGKLEFKKCNVTDLNALRNITNIDKYDTFIHFAWAGSAGDGRFDYNLQMQNALNTVECMKVAKELGCSRFVCAGTIMEYEVESAIHTQGTKPGMGYIYGMGKLMAHCMCKSVAASIDIELVWPMITNAYGVGEFSPRFVNTTLRKIINNESLHFTAATQNYDFVYVTDVANAFFLVAKNGNPFCEYIIGSGNARPLKNFILEMIQVCDSDSKIKFGDVPFTGTDLPISTFSISSIVDDCGFKPLVNFAEGTKKMIDWMKNK